ncbi:MAG: dephospho-CoA kinase [Bacteroidetes bacterium]|nr:dephospho-CoA kinase [Bacteroidota bacterium]
MVKIGITGGIGSGKSTVCKVFEILGVPIFYADVESKKILSGDDIINKKIISTFGKSILDDAGLIERKKLATIVFNNKDELEKLNTILHPAVALHFENWVKKQNTPYVLKEAAILFESGAYKQVDKKIVIVAPLELKIKRTISRDAITVEEVLSRMKNQLTDEEKIKRSDFVIYNDEQQLLVPQVLQIHSLLIAEN